MNEKLNLVEILKDCPRGIENQNIVDVISIPEKKNYRERYKRISQSATFKRVYHNKSIGDVISVEN